MRILALTLMLAVAAFLKCYGDGSETAVVLDLSRRNTSVSLSFTEYCDHTIRATVRNGGDDYPVNGYDVSLVFGGSSTGCVYEGSNTNVNEVLFHVDAASMPTNGKYTVQFLATRGLLSNEWGRGTLRVKCNPGMSYMPSCWMGYQKVAKIAASLITPVLMTNEIVVAAMSNLQYDVDIEFDASTNECVIVGKTWLDGLDSMTRFYRDMIGTTQQVYRTNKYSNGKFFVSGWNITNASFIVSNAGGNMVWTNDTQMMFRPATTNATGKFKVLLGVGTDSQRNSALE